MKVFPNHKSYVEYNYEPKYVKMDELDLKYASMIVSKDDSLKYDIEDIINEVVSFEQQRYGAIEFFDKSIFHSYSGIPTAILYDNYSVPIAFAAVDEADLYTDYSSSYKIRNELFGYNFQIAIVPIYNILDFAISLLYECIQKTWYPKITPPVKLSLINQITDVCNNYIPHDVNYFNYSCFEKYQTKNLNRLGEK